MMMLCFIYIHCFANMLSIVVIMSLLSFISMMMLCFIYIHCLADICYL